MIVLLLIVQFGFAQEPGVTLACSGNDERFDAQVSADRRTLEVRRPDRAPDAYSLTSRNSVYAYFSAEGKKPIRLDSRLVEEGLDLSAFPNYDLALEVDQHFVVARCRARSSETPVRSYAIGFECRSETGTRYTLETIGKESRFVMTPNGGAPVSFPCTQAGNRLCRGEQGWIQMGDVTRGRWTTGVATVGGAQEAVSCFTL